MNNGDHKANDAPAPEPEKTPQPDGEQNMPNGGRPFIMMAVNPAGEVVVSGWVGDEMITDWLLASGNRACQALREKKLRLQRVNESGGLVAGIRSKLFPK